MTQDYYQFISNDIKQTISNILTDSGRTLVNVSASLNYIFKVTNFNK
jgi:hypothetical protein